MTNYDRVREEIKGIIIRFSKQRETIIAKTLTDFLDKEDMWAKEAIDQILSKVLIPADDQEVELLSEEEMGRVASKLTDGFRHYLLPEEATKAQASKMVQGDKETKWVKVKV